MQAFCNSTDNLLKNYKKINLIIFPNFKFMYFPAAPSVPPTLTSTSPKIETLQARLECRWTPLLNETINYTWMDDNNTVVNSEMEDGVSVVKFSKVSRYLAGRYTCNVTTAGGSITGGPVSLVVHCEYHSKIIHILTCIYEFSDINLGSVAVTN